MDGHEHVWAPCASCPNQPGPCACAGGTCCPAQKAEQEQESSAREGWEWAPIVLPEIEPEPEQDC